MTHFPDSAVLTQLAQLAMPHSRLLRSWPLSGGMSAELTALELARPDGQTTRLVVRRPNAALLARNPQAARDEFRLLQRLYPAGVAVPEPYALDESSVLAPALLTVYVEGATTFVPHGPDFFVQLATHLAQIHHLDLTQQDLTFLPHQSTNLVGMIGANPTECNAAMDEARIRSIVEAAWPWPQPNPIALLHGDFWPGNVLWRDEQLVAVVDWEDAYLGDPLIDLAISRLDIAWIFGHEAMHAFTAQYQKLRALDDTYLAYWDLCAALRLIRLAGADLAGWAAFFEPYGRSDITARSILNDYTLFITQAFARLNK